MQCVEDDGGRNDLDSDVVTDCIHKLHREPRLVVRVSADISDEQQAEIHGLADRHGFTGRIVVLPEPALKGANCHVEWAGGGLVGACLGRHGCSRQVVEGE